MISEGRVVDDIKIVKLLMISKDEVVDDIK